MMFLRNYAWNIYANEFKLRRTDMRIANEVWHGLRIFM